MRFDLHIHSNYSTDSNLAVDDILRQAVRKGLDGIAICDHNTIEGSLHAIERARELSLPLLVIPGIEVSTSDGHLIVIGIRENIEPGLPVSETIGIARQKGAVLIAPHPFKKDSMGLAAKDADAVETFNSRCIFGENKRAKELALSLGKPEVGGKVYTFFHETELDKIHMRSINHHLFRVIWRIAVVRSMHGRMRAACGKNIVQFIHAFFD